MAYTRSPPWNGPGRQDERTLVTGHRSGRNRDPARRFAGAACRDSGIPRHRGRLLRSVARICHGHHLELACTGVDRFGLPVPRLLGCDVGTTLYWRDGDGWRRDERYRSEMRSRLGKVDWNEVDDELEVSLSAHLQEPEHQSEFKRSYYVAPDKSTCLQFVRGVLGVSSAQTVYAGDSGNDVAPLVSGCFAVVVGNATADVAGTVRAEAAARDLEARLFFAREPFAAGVLAGVRHFGFLTDG
ncbi:MAG: HAD family hydrolase [bacterium]